MSEALDPACVRCKFRRTLKDDHVAEDGRVLFGKGEFAISCRGIPASYEDHLDTLVGGRRNLVEFSEEEVEQLLQGLDPIRWAKANLLSAKGGWDPRGASEGNVESYGLDEDATSYQEVMLRCTAQRKAFRLGRRTGKTEVLAVQILHKMVTWPDGGCKVLLVCPFKAQIDLVFGRIEELIAGSPKIRNSIKRCVKNPFHEIEMHNGSHLRGFSAGTNSGQEAGSVRGQAGDLICLDESDYMSAADIDSVVAILMDHPETQLITSSTPTGRREKFYEQCNTPSYREFHFPSMANPQWGPAMEAEFRTILTAGAYVREVEAGWGEEDQGVFRKRDMEIAMEMGGGYKYDEQRPLPGWVYTIGVDWNPVVGTEIMVIGARRVSPEAGEILFRPVEVVTIEKQAFTEAAANSAIIEANRRWNPIAIYLDYGGGGVNHLEQLEMFSMGKDEQTADGRLKRITKTINFSSTIEIYDPWTKQPEKKPIKPVMVENCIRKMEERHVELTSHDPVLTAQMRNYIITKLTITGRPTYGMREEKVGDHRLDAFMLAMLAFQMEATIFGKPVYGLPIRFAGRFGEGLTEEQALELAKAQSKARAEMKELLTPRKRDLTPKLGQDRNGRPPATSHDHEIMWEAESRRRKERNAPRFSKDVRGVPHRRTF